MTTPARAIPLRRGSVLIVALLLLMAITSIALLLARSTRVDGSAAANYVAKVQAEAVADGAIAYVRSILNGTAGQLPGDGDFYNQRQPLANGYFWVIKHSILTDNNIRFGLSDEAARININTATVDTLIRLPIAAMNPDIAADIIAWRSPRGPGAAGGVDSGYYEGLPDPYNAKNAPFETLDELLLVKDITPDVLYGEDVNRNSILDPGEDTDGDGMLTHGLADYFTVYSREQNTNAQNRPRVNVNGNPNGIRAVLSAAGISAARVNTIMLKITATLQTPTSQPSGTGTGTGTGSRSGPVVTVTTTSFRNVIDFYYRAGLTIEEFKKVADNLTATTQNPIRGLININTAPREVLMCLGTLTESDADAIVSHRGDTDPNATPTLYNTLADLIDVIPRDKAVAIGGLVTTRSFRVSADILAVDGSGKSFKRVWVVFDTRSSPVRAIYYRDITDLGWPLDKQTLTDLRSGTPLAPPMTPNAPQVNSNQATGAH